MLNIQFKSINKYALFIYVYTIMGSCTTFHSDAKYNDISKSGQYIKISNEKLKFELLSFGDFIYASDKKIYKKIYTHFGHSQPTPKDLILYAATTDPQYYYYVFNDNPHLQLKTTLDGNTKTINCYGKYLTMIIQNSAPKKDIVFLLDNFKCEK